MSRHTLDFDDDYKLEGELLSSDAIMLHFNTDPAEWGLTQYKYFLARWTYILEELKSKGIVEVFSVVDKEEKVMKFQTMFGMIPLIEMNNVVVYRRFT